MFNVNFEGIKQTIGLLIGESHGQDAIQILTQDHDRVKKNFADFEKAEGEEKRTLAAETMLDLKLHAKVEELLVYPIIRKEDEKLMNEAEEEHHLVDFLISELQAMDLDDDHFEAKFKVLGECVKHHIQEEQSEAFPKLRQSGTDLNELGAEIAARKEQLINEFKNIKQFGEKDKQGVAAKRPTSRIRTNETSSEGRKAGPKKASAKKPAAKKAAPKKTAASKTKTKTSSKKAASSRPAARKTAKSMKSTKPTARGKATTKSKPASKRKTSR